MKFGLMYEIQIPEPHYPGIERDIYKQVLEQVTLADEVGFDHFWTVEHHFLKEFSHCSAPEGVVRGDFAAHLRISASATPWPCCRRSTTTRCGLPSAPRCSTS